MLGSTHGAIRGKIARLGLLSLLGLTSLASSHGPVEWDQAAVTKLVVELESKLDALLSDPGVAPEQFSVIRQRKHDAAVATMKNVRRLIRDMRSSLEQGDGRNVTESYYDQAGDLIREVRALAEDSWITPSAQEKASAVRALMARLGTYYRDP